METKDPHDSHQTGLSCGFWRRWRDSNSRARFQTYSLSRGAPSPTWVHLQMGGASRIFSCGGDVGGESGIRTHGSFESPVFKTGSLNHSDISPHLFKQIRGEDYLTIPPPTCQELKWTGCPSLPGRTIGQRPGSSFQIPLSNVLRRRIFPSRAWSIMERNFSLSSGNPPFRGR